MNKKFLRLQLKEIITCTEKPLSCTIVPYNAEEHQSLIPGLYSQGFDEPPWEDDWYDIPQFDPKGVFLIQDNKTGEYAGFIISFSKETCNYISVLTILPAFRGCSYGNLLIKKAVSSFQAKNSKPIIIDVEPHRTAAINLYKKIGFKEI